eukprot:11183708-Lingulodinium_polyedra.AAC.1
MNMNTCPPCTAMFPTGVSYGARAAAPTLSIPRGPTQDITPLSFAEIWNNPMLGRLPSALLRETA